MPLQFLILLFLSVQACSPEAETESNSDTCNYKRDALDNLKNESDSIFHHWMILAEVNTINQYVDSIPKILGEKINILSELYIRCYNFVHYLEGTVLSLLDGKTSFSFEEIENEVEKSFNGFNDYLITTENESLIMKDFHYYFDFDRHENCFNWHKIRSLQIRCYTIGTYILKSVLLDLEDPKLIDLSGTKVDTIYMEEINYLPPFDIESDIGI